MASIIGDGNDASEKHQDGLFLPEKAG